MSSTVIDRGYENIERHPSAPADPAANPRSMSYKFSPEEVRALKECNRESFFFRCLPFSTVLGSVTYLAVKQGYLRPSIRFGPTPKVMIACTIGYFLGKFSYQQQCIEKLMALPNSKLGEQLRQQRGRSTLGWVDTSHPESYMPPSDFPPDTTQQPDSDSSTSQVFTDVGDTRPLDSFDSDVSRPGYSASDEEFYAHEEALPPPPTKSTTYEELRRQNRDDFYRGIKQQPTAPPPPVKVQQRGDNDPSKQGVKNKYGDVWEKSD